VTKSKLHLAAFAAMLCCTIPICAGAAQSVGSMKLLHSFDVGTTTTTNLVRGADGNYYGTTAPRSDIVDGGTIYRMTPAGDVTTLHTFGVISETDGTSIDGSYVQSLSVGSDGNLYGTTSGGGSDGAGTLFRITPEGILMTLYNFQSYTGPGINQIGTDAKGKLVLGSDGALYGMTNQGGDNGFGTVYRLTIDGAISSIYSFPTYDPSQGYHSSFLISGMDGKLYFMRGLQFFSLTYEGDPALFYTFDSTSYQPPSSIMQANDGNFYGFFYSETTGGLFKLTADGIYTTLRTFDYSPTLSMTLFNPGCFVPVPSPPACFESWFVKMSNDDGGGSGDLMQGADGYLYETANGAGGGFGGGTLWRLTLDGNYTTLFAFGDRFFPGAAIPAINGDGGELIIAGAKRNFTKGSSTTLQPSILKFSTSTSLSVETSFSPSVVTRGRPTTLSWSSSGARSCNIANDLALPYANLIAGFFPGSGGSLQTWTTHSGSRTFRTNNLYADKFSPPTFTVSFECEAADGSVANATTQVSVTKPAIGGASKKH